MQAPSFGLRPRHKSSRARTPTGRPDISIAQSEKQPVKGLSPDRSFHFFGKREILNFESIIPVYCPIDPQGMVMSFDLFNVRKRSPESP